LFLQSGELIIATHVQRKVVPNWGKNYTAYTDGAYTYQNTDTVKGHGVTFCDNWKTKGTLNFREIVK
jgi:hypothetical protein